MSDFNEFKTINSHIGKSFLDDEQLTPVIHTPVMDDSVMTAEDHLRRRRAIY